MPSRRQHAALTIAILSVALGTLLQGCATDNVGTLDAGAALPRAQYQILGKTKYDQAWVDKTIEGEVAGFHFARPLKRPASLDAAKVVVMPAKPGVLPIVTQTIPAVVTVAKKPSLLRRLNDKVRKLEGK